MIFLKILYALGRILTFLRLPSSLFPIFLHRCIWHICKCVRVVSVHTTFSTYQIIILFREAQDDLLIQVQLLPLAGGRCVPTGPVNTSLLGRSSPPPPRFLPLCVSFKRALIPCLHEGTILLTFLSSKRLTSK